MILFFVRVFLFMNKGLYWNFILYLNIRFDFICVFGRVIVENFERGMKIFVGFWMKFNYFYKLIDGVKNWNIVDEDCMLIRLEWIIVDWVFDMRFDILVFLFCLEFGWFDCWWLVFVLIVIIVIRFIGRMSDSLLKVLLCILYWM